MAGILTVEEIIVKALGLGDITYTQKQPIRILT